MCSWKIAQNVEEERERKRLRKREREKDFIIFEETKLIEIGLDYAWARSESACAITFYPFSTLKQIVHTINGLDWIIKIDTHVFVVCEILE